MSDDQVTPENTPSPAEERINALLAQRDAAAQNSDQLAQQNEILATRLAALENQIANPPAAPSSQSTPPPAGNDKPLSSQDIAQMVQATVKEAISPVTDQLQASQQKAALDALHAQSLQQATQQYPDLSDPNSPLSQVAQKLWNGRPDLQSLADAPVVIATMAKGALAFEKKIEQQAVQRKEQARVVQPPPVSDKATKPEAGSRREVVDAVRQQVQDSGIKGSSANQFADLFRSTLTEAVADDQGE